MEAKKARPFLALPILIFISLTVSRSLRWSCSPCFLAISSLLRSLET